MDDGNYRLEMTILSAANNSNPVAAAAYRGGKCYYDKRAMKYHGFSHRRDVIADYVILPESSPLSMLDVEGLWNSVYSNERRSDARYCREIQIDVPKVISIGQSCNLIKTWTRKFIVEEFGVPCQISIHLKHSRNELHAHVAFPERRWESGAWSNKIRGLNSKKTLLNLRKSCADAINGVLEANGSSVHVHYRSNHDRQVDALKTVNDAARTYEERIRAYAEFISLEYFVSGKVPRNSEYRHNMNEHPDVQRSRSERVNAIAQARSLLDEYLEEAIAIDQHLSAEKSRMNLLFLEMQNRQNKRRKRGRNAASKKLHVTKADLASQDSVLKMANTTIREEDLTTPSAISANAPHLPEANEDKPHKPVADDSAQKRKLSPAEIRARQMRRRGGR